MRYGKPWWYKRMIEEGIKFTLQRKLILDVLTRTKRHLSAEEIYFIVRKFYPNIGFATVYRTLDLLTRMGIVSKLNFGDGRMRYELPEKENASHIHLICKKCGKVFEDGGDENEKIKEIEKNVSSKYNFKVENLKIFFMGKCENCQKGGD
ncbi:MAG TPA: transcriptional repressor [Firmicutes bacterium]|nr:transcriptional repressor [Bacillota bacterium]